MISLNPNLFIHYWFVKTTKPRKPNQTCMQLSAKKEKQIKVFWIRIHINFSSDLILKYFMLPENTLISVISPFVTITASSCLETE